MRAANRSLPGLPGLRFVLLTVGCWGVYGVFLHIGQTAMQDPINGHPECFGIGADSRRGVPEVLVGGWAKGIMTPGVCGE